MNIRTYTLLACLASMIALLLSVAPLIRAELDYRNPEGGEIPSELTSVLAYRADTLKAANERLLVILFREDSFQAMYDAARESHLRTLKHQAGKTRVAYRTAAGVSLLFFVTHLWWARRLSRSGPDFRAVREEYREKRAEEERRLMEAKQRP